jgi:hypothetical protein
MCVQKITLQIGIAEMRQNPLQLYRRWMAPADLGTLSNRPGLPATDGAKGLGFDEKFTLISLTSVSPSYCSLGGILSLVFRQIVFPFLALGVGSKPGRVETGSSTSLFAVE